MFRWTTNLPSGLSQFWAEVAMAVAMVEEEEEAALALVTCCPWEMTAVS